MAVLALSLLHYISMTGLTTCVYVRMYVCMNEWMNVCMYVCMHVCYSPCCASEFANNKKNTQYFCVSVHSCRAWILAFSSLMYVKTWKHLNRFVGYSSLPRSPHPWFHHQLEHSSWVQLVGLADKRSPIPEDTNNYWRRTTETNLYII